MPDRYLARVRRYKEAPAPYLDTIDQMEELRDYLDLFLMTASLLSGEELPAEDPREALRAFEDYLWEREALSLEDGVPLRLPLLCSSFRLSPFGRFALILATAPEFDDKYREVFASVQKGAEPHFPKHGLAVHLYQAVYELELGEKHLFLLGEDPLHRFLLQAPAGAAPVTHHDRPLTPNPRVVQFLMGLDGLALDSRPFLSLFTTEMECPSCTVLEDVLERISGILERLPGEVEEGTLINLFGREGIGRRTLVKNVGHRMGVAILFVALQELSGLPLAEMRAKLDQLFLETVLSSALICLVVPGELQTEAQPEGGPQPPFPLQEVIRHLGEQFPLLFAVSEERLPVREEQIHTIGIEVADLSAHRKRRLWEEIGAAYRFAPDVEIDSNIGRYVLSGRLLKKVFQTAQLAAYADKREEIAQRDIVFAVKQNNTRQLGNCATLIKEDFTWDDLVLEPETKAELMLVCNRVKYSVQVMESWGFSRKMPYGKGICAVFYGQSGTGKTMSVHVLANELGLDVYRIDLSQMVSKYIGETEKNITNLFRRAKDTNAILFFDEADSLFSTRTEVSNANDRNANMETAHLLQMIEDYSGITILATNNFKNFDAAFKRRIQFAVNYSMPSEQSRLTLWRSILPPETPVDKNLQFEFFARQFELSGSSIKEILVHAAYLAAASDQPVSDRLVVSAIRYHMQKQGKVPLKKDFGPLEIYLDDLPASPQQ